MGSHTEVEEAGEFRCGAFWQLPSLGIIAEPRQIEHFASPWDERLFDHLRRSKYRFGIQGDIGEIIDKNLLPLFPEGIINFHPGDLPAYRGCDAPEWQLLHGLPVVCTAHLVDEGVDTGPIITKRQLTSSIGSDHKFRASLYPQIASFVAELCSELLNKTEINSTPQESGIYRKRMSEEVREQMRQLLDCP